MGRAIIVFSIFGLFILFNACQDKVTSPIDKEVYIPVKGNQLYIRLAGNLNGPIVLLLHGGPGGSSGFDRNFYKGPLEGDFLIGYLDQRGCGKSPAEDNDSLITMQQFVEDLDVVVDSLKKWYPGKPIHLLGGSWGGTYGFLYLLKHQEKIRSFICVSGKIDGPYENKVLIEHEEALVKRQLAAIGDLESVRADSLRYIGKELERIKQSNYEDFFDDVTLLKFTFPEVLGFNPYWYDSAAHQKAIELSKDSAFYASAHYDINSYDSVNAKGTHVNQIFRNTPAYNHIQLTNQLSAIKIPVAVIGGAEDYVVGPGHAKLIYDGLTGLRPDKKQLHILEGAAHNVNLEAADRYYPIVRSFLLANQ